MDCVNVGDFGGADNRTEIQITLGALGGADANGFVRKADVKTMTVCFRVDCDGFDAEILARADHAESDLTSICYQYFAKHVEGSERTDGEERLAVFDGPAVLKQFRDNGSRNLGLNFVHQLHGLNNAKNLFRFHSITHPDERRIARRGGVIVRSDNGRLHNRIPGVFFGRHGFIDGRWGRGWSGRRDGNWGGSANRYWQNRWHHHVMRGRRGAANANAIVAALHLEFGDSGLIRYTNQFLNFINRHDWLWRKRQIVIRRSVLSWFGLEPDSHWE